jgi:hypothetical protein
VVLHVYNIRNLKVPRFFFIAMKSVLYPILSVSWFHCILLRLNVYFHMLGNENAKAKLNLLCKRAKKWYCMWDNAYTVEVYIVNVFVLFIFILVEILNVRASSPL